MHDGSSCADHPQAGVATCPHCGSFACAGCVVRYSWGAFACRECAQRGRPRYPLAWQARMSPRSWWQAFTLVVFQPRTLFPFFPELSLPRAAVFALIGAGVDAASSLVGPEPSLWWMGCLGTVLVTPLMALAMYLSLRLSTDRASFAVLLAAIWLLDGAYDVVCAPLNWLSAESVRSVLLGGAAYFVVFIVYVRVLWWLCRQRFRLSTAQALPAIAAYCLAGTPLAALAMMAFIDDTSTEAPAADLLGPAGIAPD